MFAGICIIPAQVPIEPEQTVSIAFITRRILLCQLEGRNLPSLITKHICISQRVNSQRRRRHSSNGLPLEYGASNDEIKLEGPITWRQNSHIINPITTARMIIIYPRRPLDGVARDDS